MQRRLSGWAVSSTQKKTVRLGLDLTQLCPELERLSLTPGSLLPSPGLLAALPDYKEYCSFDLVGWFGVYCYYCYGFFRYSHHFPFPFLTPNPPVYHLLLSFKCVVFFFFSLIAVTLMHAYRNWVLLRPLKLQRPGTAFPSNGRWGRQRQKGGISCSPIYYRASQNCTYYKIVHVYKNRIGNENVAQR